MNYKRHPLWMTLGLMLLSSTAYAGSGSILYDMQNITTFGGPGNGDGQFSKADHAALGPDNKIYVADQDNNRVQVFDSNGNYLTQFGSPGQFSNPLSIAFDSAGNILVVDTSNNRVQIWDPNMYSQVGIFGSTGSGPGQFNFPSWITTDSAGNFYITDGNNSRVNIFDSNKTYVDSFSTPSPSSVTVANNKIYVSFEGADTISIYDASTYAFLGTLAPQGTNPGEIDNPVGLSSDAQGNIYVSEYANNRIQIFDKNGNSLLVYNNSAAASGFFVGPNGMHADANGKIYVSEYAGHRVHILQLTSTETFTGSPAGGDEIAATPLSYLELRGAGGTFADDFIGYHRLLVGNGNWTLSGNSSFTNNVEINGGMLTNNGTLKSSGRFLIFPNNFVAGTGTFNGQFDNYGNITPGAGGNTDIGTITINGNYTHGGGIYEVNVNDTGASDLIDITGTATLSGSDVQVFAANGNYAANTNYTILSATNGVAGTFNSVTSNLAFLTPTLVYTNPNAVILNLVNPNFSTGITDFAPYASGSNQAGVASALTEYSASQFGGDTATYNTVSAFNTSEAAQLVKEVTPDEVASIPQVQSAMVTSMQTPLFSRMNTLNPVKSDTQSYALFTPTAQSLRPDQVWLEAVGGFSSQQANNGAAGYRLGTTGMRGGVDKVIDNNNLLGLSVGHARGNVDYKSSFDKSQVQYTHVDLYGKHHSTQRNLVIEGIIGTGGGRIDSTRPITAGGLGFLANGNTNAYDVTGSVKLSNPIALNSSTLIPNITGIMSWQRQNGFTETGAGPFNLAYETNKATPITITPMINWQKTITSKNDTFSITPDLGIGATWQPNELERTINANFSGATGTNGFNVAGTKQKPLSLNVTAAVTMIPFTENAAIPNLTAATTIQTNSTTTNGTATLNAKWAF